MMKKMKSREIRQMQTMAFKWYYGCSGELYRLLETDTLSNLISNIKKGSLNSKTNQLFGSSRVSFKENFLIILDNYIGYIRDNYLIRHIELNLIIENTLKNFYSKILFSDKYYYDHTKMFITEFKKMFLFNLMDNTIFYAHIDNNKDYVYLQKAYNFLKNKKLNKEQDLNEIEKFFKKIINHKKDNLYYFFQTYKETIKKEFSFYAFQIDCVYGGSI